MTLVMVSCGGTDKQANPLNDQLLDGNWRLMVAEEPVRMFQSGLKFAEDGQVFFLDTQGHVVPPHHEQKFKLAGDTLTIIDYKYEEHVIYEKGTSIGLIRTLTDEELVLEMIHPKKDARIYFKNMK